MVLIFIATALLLCSPIVSFLKDRDDIITNKKGRGAWKFPVTFLIIGLLGVGLSFYNSKSSLDDKVAADSATKVAQAKVDSLSQLEINFLGGGAARPLFAFVAMSSSLFQFAIMDTCKYPLRDLRVTVQDDLAFAAYKAKFNSATTDSGIFKRDQMIYIRQGFGKYGREFRIPFIASQDYEELFTENVGDSNHIKYTVSITWSNGSLAYYIECFRGTDGWREKRTCYDRLNNVPVSE